MDFWKNAAFRTEHFMKKFAPLSLNSMSLGDIVATFYIFENLGKKTNQIYSFQMDNFCKEISNCFNLKHICSTNIQCQPIVDFLTQNYANKPCVYQWRHQGFLNNYHFISLLSDYANDWKLTCEALTPQLPPIISEPILVQFDGRTSRRQKRDISNKKKKSFILSFENSWACIGGIDTQKYLGKKTYYKGNVSYIIQHLLGCELFVGSDSGISHLAGACGIKSKILILGSCYHCINYYYKHYQNTTTISNFIKMI